MTFKIEAGKRYVAINGVVTGPLVAALVAGKFKCPDVSIGQVSVPSVSQIWNSDGTVYKMEDGESEHGLIAEYVEEKAVSEDIASALNRIAELEGINASLEFQILQMRNKCADLNGKLSFAESSRKHWHDELQKEKRKQLRAAPFVPGRHPKSFVFDAYRSFANGGTVGVLSGDAERNLDKRIDNAFTAINRLNRELNEERSSTNARALFFGALAGVVVVTLAFGAHFVL